MNKQIINVVICNILWGIIPILLSDLSEYSVFTIIFTRLGVSGIATIILGLIIILFSQKKDDNNDSQGLEIGHIFQYLKSENGDFKNIPQWAYLIIIGVVTLSFQIIFFFFGLRFAGVIFTFSAIPASIVIFAFISWIRGSETMDSFKAVYLFYLFMVIAIIFYEKILGQDGIQGVSFFGLVSVAIYLIIMVIEPILIKKDRITDWEIKLDLGTKRKYKLIRSLIKSGLSQIFGAISTFVLPFFIVLFIEDSEISLEARQFYAELPSIMTLLFSLPGFLLILLTIISFSLWYISSAYWPREALSFDQWASILGVISTVVGIIFSILFLNEIFPLFSIIIIVIFLGLSIILRYLHESTNSMNAQLMIKIKNSCLKEFYSLLQKQSGIRKIESICGFFDVYITVQVSNAKKYNQMVYTFENSGLIMEIQEYKTINVFK